MKEKLFIFTLMLLAVPLGGELKFYPFFGDFRVSLGTPIFFFFLLWLRHIHPVISGVFVGITVVTFRVLLSWIDLGIDGGDALILHTPAFFYYFIFGSFFYVLGLHRLYDRPLWLGVLGIILEILASIVEITFRYFLSGLTITWATIWLIVVIAIIRSFFVLGFYNILLFRQAKLAEEQQRKRNEKMLLLISNLYVETIQLNKSIQYAEEITRSCYVLYRELKEQENDRFSKTALKIAGEVHEIKKDNQRIYAGLSKLISKENLSDFMEIEEILSIVVKSNQHYAQLLKKSIHFQMNIKGEHPAYHTYIVLSLLNNLVANAVEVINETGEINLTVNLAEKVVHFHVSDDGPGIREKKKGLIFQPGYTTKYDQSGNPSNGIGLSYVREIVEKAGGEIELLDDINDKRTTFQILMPIQSLIQKG